MSSKNDNFYKDLPSRIDTILGDDLHLHRLKQLADARNAYIKEHNINSREHIHTDSFAHWLRDRWGLSLTYNAESKGLTGFDVVDEQKYLLFCMVFP